MIPIEPPKKVPNEREITVIGTIWSSARAIKVNLQPLKIHGHLLSLSLSYTRN